MEEIKFKPKEYYREKIVEMVKEIEEETLLKFLHDLICSFKKKWGI